MRISLTMATTITTITITTTIIEGLSSFVGGFMGLCHGTTSYSQVIGFIGITGVSGLHNIGVNVSYIPIYYNVVYYIILYIIIRYI